MYSRKPEQLTTTLYVNDIFFYWVVFLMDFPHPRKVEGCVTLDRLKPYGFLYCLMLGVRNSLTHSPLPRQINMTSETIGLTLLSEAQNLLIITVI